MTFNKEKKFNNRTKVYNNSLTIIIIFSFMSFLTLAFFFVSEFSSGYVGMSGKVDIEAVGSGTTYSSIEDTDTSNLVIKLEDNYDVLIPGMQIEAIANVKVMQSTTKPLLRAKFSIELSQVVDGERVEILPEVDNSNLSTNLINQFNDIIIQDNDWYKFTDGYFYYIGTHSVESDPKNTQLMEVDATNGNAIVLFIDEPIIFPEYITSEYSSLGVKLVITFEAIQNFIPDTEGNEYFYEKTDGTKVNNTIEFSKYIFDDERDTSASTDQQYNVTLTVDGVSTNYKFSDGITIAEVLSSENINITDSNSCGWFSDIALIHPVLTTQTISNGLHLYTKMSTDSKLTFTKSGSTYIVSKSGSPTGEVVIPRMYNGALVTQVASEGFRDTTITNVVLPASIQILNALSFNGCNKLESINFPEGLTTIYDHAFQSCNSLTSLTFPSTLTSMTSTIINNNYIETLIVLDGNSKYHSSGNCVIETASKTLIRACNNSIIPDDGSVTFLNAQCFFGNLSQKSVYIPKSITSISGNPFARCINMIEMTVADDNSVYHSSNNCIIHTASKVLQSGCRTSTIVNDGSITSIGSKAFSYCEYLKQILIPSSITSIGEYAFNACYSLETIFISSSVVSITDTFAIDSEKNIASCLFGRCSKLSIYTDATEAPSGWGTYWNYVAPSTQATVYYGVSQQEYLTTIGQIK